MRQKQLDIGVDLMGSDNAPSVLIDSVIQYALNMQHVSFYLFGTIAVEKYFLKQKIPLNVNFVSVAQAIEMDENPLLAIRQKKDSSICVGMRYLAQKKISALISSGNTGALVSAAKTIVGMKRDILRPALLAWLPTKKKPLAILDVGANVNVKPIHLVQFAKMGIELCKAKKIAVPRVGLLNIGSEKLKGTSLLQETYQELISLKDRWEFDFKGNIEGKDVFKGDVDILVTDGFTGNIFLKTSEGVTSLILDRLNEKIPKEICNTISTHLKDLESYLHYAQYPGAILIGIKALVIKCHSYSSPESFVNGIKDAISQKIS
jgi:phosphate acyltransferase